MPNILLCKSKIILQSILYEESNWKNVFCIVLIAGSVGSYGACLHDGSEYRGDYVKKVPLEIIKTWHRPRISALVEAGVDFLAFETIPALAEAEVLVELLKEFPNQKAWVSFTCKVRN